MPSDDIVVRVENLGKRYLLPQKHVEDYSRAPTLGRRLKEFFPSLLGAEERDFFWALRDVSFEVKRGEVLGIVGENGSGKSTLLKILSGVTPPTEGSAQLRGRVGSLLEVGTGFHPDLTGRENIYFNGSLLGLRTTEVHSKIGQIIDFSGIGEFIDVPVKRYSSGMYVRLAYSVAALLESEIMILDEVLAVGDAGFRSKSEQNIRNNALSGRTVLLVSHNPKAIATICDRAIILYKGRLVFAGDAKDVMAEYLSNAYKEERAETAENGAITATRAVHMATPRTPQAYANIANTQRAEQSLVPPPWLVLKWISVHGLNGEQRAEFSTGEGVRIRIGFEGLVDPASTYFCILINNSAQERMTTIYSTDNGSISTKSSGVVECTIPELMLGVGLYNLGIDCGTYDVELSAYVCRESVPFATFIRVKDNGSLQGVVRTEFQGVVHRTEWSTLEPAADNLLKSAIRGVKAGERVA